MLGRALVLLGIGALAGVTGCWATEPNPRYQAGGSGADLSASAGPDLALPDMPVDAAVPGALPDLLSVADLPLPDLSGTDLSPPPGTVTVPSGIFLMGTPDATGRDNERPEHYQAVSAFVLDATEVSVKDYRTCVTAGSCAPPANDAGCVYGQGGKDDFPVNCINQSQASAYCMYKGGGRLPTEIEWEYAARGSMNAIYPWGNDTPSNQLCWSRGAAGPCQVGTAGGRTILGVPRVDGAADLGGNLREWTSSKACGYKLPNNGLACLLETSVIVRGGTYLDTVATSVRAARREGVAPTDRSPLTGFRCVR